MSAWNPPDPSDYDCADYCEGLDYAELHDAERDTADDEVIPF
jgi:hypothetical protein